jgi:hypothetical protein
MREYQWCRLLRPSALPRYDVWVILTPNVQRRAEPVCGRCGYCVRGISQLTCPECGSDLREVGILAPNMRVPLPRFVWAILWTLVLPAVALPISLLLLATVLPFAIKQKSTRQIVCQAPYLNITLALDAEGWASKPAIMGPASFQPDRFTLLKSGRAVTTFLETHIARGDYYYWSSSGAYVSQSSGFNGAVIANWLGSSGANAGDPKVRAVCDQIFKVISQMHQGTGGASTPLLDAGGNQVGVAKPTSFWVVHDEPNPILIGVLSFFWLVIYSYGLVIIFRRRRETGGE